MNIVTLNLNMDNSRVDKKEAICPYKDIEICMASISLMFIDNYKKKNYCCTEDYDDCPLFLSKILRRT